MTFRQNDFNAVRNYYACGLYAPNACSLLLVQAIRYYVMVRFRAIGLKSHPIAQFEENRRPEEKNKAEFFAFGKFTLQSLANKSGCV